MEVVSSNYFSFSFYSLTARHQYLTGKRADVRRRNIKELHRRDGSAVEMNDPPNSKKERVTAGGASERIRQKNTSSMTTPIRRHCD